MESLSFRPLFLALSLVLLHLGLLSLGSFPWDHILTRSSSAGA